MLAQIALKSEFHNSIDITNENPRTKWEESDTIEFKKSLQLSGETISRDYLKTISGFANNKGGTIIFGISPDNNELVGIKSSFENLDNRYVSSTIANSIDGSFDYIFFTTKILGKVIGFLKIEQAMTKPVILKVDSTDFKFGEIYYRYPAQTTKIQASDLRRIINDEISNRLKNTIGNISKLVEFGDNAAILNTISGEIEVGASTTKLIVDESILSKLNIIREGKFVEKEGAPAYIIKGQIESTNVEIIEKNIPSVINESDIFEYFLTSTCEFPKLVIERLVFASSPYNPLHFFIKESGLDKEQAINFIKDIDKPEINQSVKEKILERICGYTYGSSGLILEDINIPNDILNIDDIVNQIINEKGLNPTSKTINQVKRSIFYNQLYRKLPIKPEIFKKESKSILEAFSNLKAEQLLENKKYYIDTLKEFFPLEKQGSSNASLLRKVMCFVDEVYYMTKNLH